MIISGSAYTHSATTAPSTAAQITSRIECCFTSTVLASTNSVSTSSSASGTKITEYSTLTVEVTEKQALKLYEIENDYTYKLVLNPRK